MAFSNTCSICGANLDPGERCDCQEKKEHETQRLQSMFKMGRNGQMQLNLFQEVNSVGKTAVK